MTPIRSCLVLAVLLATFSAQATLAQTDSNTISISMIAATSIREELPFVIFQGKPWSAEPNAAYAKLHMYFDEAFHLSRIEMKACSSMKWESLAKGYSPKVFVNFDEVTGDSASESDGGVKERLIDKIWQWNFDVSARSITFNFREAKDVCVQELRLFGKGKDGKSNSVAQYRVASPRVVAGTVGATTTYEPRLSYDVSNLFDSRFEYAWLSDFKKKPKDGDVLTFTFDQQQRVEKVRIWNGYQRTVRHCQTNARATEMQIEDDSGVLGTVAVADKMGYQDIALPRPFVGKRLKLRMNKVKFGVGPKDTDTSISELRFFDGKEWFLINPIANLRAIAAANREAFRRASMVQLLDVNWHGRSNEEFPQVQIDMGDSYRDFPDVLRLRSDGSMYHARIEPTKITQDGALQIQHVLQHSGLGNYEVKEASKYRLVLRVFGSYMRKEKEMNLPVDGDCNACGWDCNKLQGAPSDTQAIFQDQVEITFDPKTAVHTVRNIGKAVKLFAQKSALSQTPQQETKGFMNNDSETRDKLLKEYQSEKEAEVRRTVQEIEKLNAKP